MVAYGRVPREGRHDPARAAAQGGRAGRHRRRGEDCCSPTGRCASTARSRPAAGASCVPGDVVARRRRVRAPHLSTPGVYVMGCEPATGKSAVALGVRQLLARRVTRLGVFRPVVADPEHDPLVDLLRSDAAPVRGVVRRDLRGGARRRGAGAGGDRRPLPGAGRAVRRRAGRRHRLRGRRHGGRAGVQRARGAQPRAAGAAGGQRARALGRGGPRRDRGGAGASGVGLRGRRRGRQPRARRPGRSGGVERRRCPSTRCRRSTC